jgi:hypothetical protein
MVGFPEFYAELVAFNEVVVEEAAAAATTNYEETELKSALDFLRGLAIVSRLT